MVDDRHHEPSSDPERCRADAVTGLRRLADTLEILPLDRATDTVGYLHASLLSVNAWVALALVAAGAVPEQQDRRDRPKVESLEHAEAAAGISNRGNPASALRACR